MAKDTSDVFHIDVLDDKHRAAFNSTLPWIFETDQGQWAFATEDEACAEQRGYREQTGHDPMTGERID